MPMNDEMQRLCRLLNMSDNVSLVLHPTIIEELSHSKDEVVRKTYLSKISKYELTNASTVSPITEKDRNRNGQLTHDYYDNCLLEAIKHNDADILITNDYGLIKKGKTNPRTKERTLSISEATDRLAKLTDSYAPLTPYPLAFDQVQVKNISVEDDFFTDLRSDYWEFDKWWESKAESIANVTFTDNRQLGSLIMTKIEDESERFDGFETALPKGRHLKIQTFKVSDPQKSLGERGIELIFKEAIKNRVDDIYVTIFRKHTKLINLFSLYGFIRYTTKKTRHSDGTTEPELVLYRKLKTPKTEYPFISLKDAANHSAYIVPIRFEYAQILFPDSIKNYQMTLSDSYGSVAKSNAIRKVYICNSRITMLKPGDLLFFYYTHKQKGLTTVGVVSRIFRANDYSVEDFIQLVRRFVVFTDEELREQHIKNSLVIQFEYYFMLPNVLSLTALKSLSILNDTPQSITTVKQEALQKIFFASKANEYLIQI